MLKNSNPWVFLIRFVGLAVIGVVVAVYIWSTQPQTGTIVPSTVKIQQKQSESKSTVENDCFVLRDIVGVDLVKQETTATGCVVRAAVVRPPAQLMVSFINKPQAQLLEETGITLRLNDSKYTKIDTILAQPAGVTQSMVFGTDTEITGMYIKSGVGVLVVSLHSFARRNPEIEQQFEQFVAGVLWE